MAKGEKIKLDQFATITEGSGPTSWKEEIKSPSVTINAQNCRYIPTGTVAQQWEAKFSQLKKTFRS